MTEINLTVIEKLKRANAAYAALKKHAVSARRELRRILENDEMENSTLPTDFNPNIFLHEIEALTRSIKRGRTREAPGLSTIMAKSRGAKRTTPRARPPKSNDTATAELISAREIIGRVVFKKLGRKINDSEWAALYLVAPFIQSHGRFPTIREMPPSDLKKKMKTLRNKLSDARANAKKLSRK